MRTVFVGLLALTGWLPAAEFRIGPHRFTLPDVFQIECVAAPPLVDRPINMAIDESGALYVTDSSGSNEKPAVQVENPTHRIVRLVDTDHDGRFDTRTVFAEKLAFPEGTMWLDGSLYVSAPPQIWKFTDHDDDGISDRREVWFDGKTLTGCANDLHGPYAGPDGFIYWCKGAFAEQRHTLGNGTPFVTRASHVFRARPDGSDFDVVMTGGMDNPVDVVFSPAGERFVSGTFFVHPGNGQRDGILHAVHGGVWGKDHDVLEGHPRTGDLMPVMAHLGPAAPSGLELLRADALGDGWRGNLLACQFNMRKVSRHQLEAGGATFKSRDTDFVVSDQPDFHPTDVLEDADGSILIADTGGWYKICCPTSRLAKPEVLGAIYRVTRRDASPPAHPRGRTLAWDAMNAAELARLLGDPRPAVADRAMDLLARKREMDALGTVLANHDREHSREARLRAIWTLARIPGEPARAAVRSALTDPHPQLRLAACNFAALCRDEGASNLLGALLADDDLHVRRAALAALGRIGDRRAIPLVAEMALPEGGRFLEHAAAYALFEIGDAGALAAIENPPAHVTTAAAMIARAREHRPSPPLRPIPRKPAPKPDPAVVAQQQARLESLAAHLPQGDPQRGAALFASARAACRTCHAIAGQGGTFGPDLTKVGAIRTGRDLLEAVVFPGASHVRSYEPVLLTASEGTQFGIVTKDAADEIVLAIGPGVTARVPRNDVQSIQDSTVSLMPAGYDGILSPAELADLVAFLAGRR